MLFDAFTLITSLAAFDRRSAPLVTCWTQPTVDVEILFADPFTAESAHAVRIPEIPAEIQQVLRDHLQSSCHTWKISRSHILGFRLGGGSRLWTRSIRGGVKASARAAEVRGRSLSQRSMMA